MESVLFHGSWKVVESPTKEGGNPFNDYGQGFYCSPDIELAREWACSEKPGAFVNHYSFEPSFNLRECNLCGKEYHVLNWLAVLMNNRVFETRHSVPEAVKSYILDEFLPDLSGYDIIRGYRADDSYFSIASAFIEGSIPLRQLERALRLGKLGEQVFVQSTKAFEALTFVSAEPVDRDLYLCRRINRDRKARETFSRMKGEALREDDVVALDIVRGKWRNNDERLR